MFVRIKQVGNHRYLQLVENHRQGHRTLQSHLCTLGRMDRLESNGRIEALLRSLSRFGRRVEVVKRDSEEVSANVPQLSPHSVLRSGLESGRKPASSESSTANEVTRPNKEEHSGEQCLAPQDERTALLKGCPLFADLDSLILASLSRIALERRLERGQFLFFEGDPVDSLYLVASGMLKASMTSSLGREIVAALYSRGDTLATVTLFIDEPHLFSCQAVKQSGVLQIRKDDFLFFLKQYPEASLGVLMRMLRVGGKRFRNAVALVSDLATERTDYRLARTLMALSVEFGSTIPFTHREIAEMAGTSSETATRFVGCLREKGIIRSSRGEIVVVDPDKLSILARIRLPK